MNRGQQWTLAGGVGLGGGLMYLLDPGSGRRRRALARDKAVHLLNKSGGALRKTSRDLGNRTKGLAAGVGSRLRKSDVPDQVLHDRVRAALGRSVSHPSAIEVLAEDGRVTLAGDVLAHEEDRLLTAVHKVRGVREVDNQLEVHESAGDVPSLQGGAGVPGGMGRLGVLQRNWPPATRLLVGTAGGALALAALKRRDRMGAVLGSVGLGLLARSLTNLESKRLLGLGAGRRAVDLHKTLNVAAPVDEVFEFWSSFENFPRFMANVLTVRRLGNNRWHWVVRGPASTTVEWDAELTRFEPERVLAWKSVEGAAVESSGLVHFTPAAEGTQVDVQLSYNPPASAVGHGVATLLGSNPKQQMDQDLVRFKSLIEDGKTTAAGKTVTRSEVEGRFEPVGV